MAKSKKPAHIAALHRKVRKMHHAHVLSEYDAGPSYHINTCSMLFNLQLSGNVYGGYEGRAITSLAGYSQSGKTRWAYQAMQEFLRTDENGICVWVDAENAFKADQNAVFSPDEVSKNFGDRFIYIKENVLEDVQGEVVDLLNHFKEEKFADQDFRVFFVIDSWGFLVTSENMKKMESYAAIAPGAKTKKIPADMGRTAAKKKQFIMYILNKVPRANATMLITNHLYGSMNEYEEDKFAGGSGLYYGAQSIPVLAALAGGKDSKDPERKTTRKIRSRMLKGREVRPFTKVDLPLYFLEGGFTKFGGMFDWCKENKLIQGKSGGPKGYVYGWANENPDTREVYSEKQVKENPEAFFTKERLDFVNQIGHALYCFASDEERAEAAKAMAEREAEFD